jgi:hypothetical protein
MTPDTIQHYEATGYPPGFEEEEERESKQIEMAEYIVTVQIPVLVPKYSPAPSLEKANATRIVELFLKEASQNADRLSRDDFAEKGDEFLFLEPTDPFEIDAKHIGVADVEPYTNPFTARTIYRDALPEKKENYLPWN